MSDVLQFSIDVHGEVTEEEIAKALELCGIEVRGVMWWARWTEEGYITGEPPISCN